VIDKHSVPVCPGEFHLPHIEHILVVEEGESLGGAGALDRGQREQVRGILAHFVRVYCHLTLACSNTGEYLETTGRQNVVFIRCHQMHRELSYGL
jgi:hypothetical protein